MSQLPDDVPLTNARPEQTVGGIAQDKFIIQQLISRIRTTTMVVVTDVTVPQDKLAPIGRCSIRPLVQQIDGNNNVYSRGEIKNVPYLRVQGGKNAVIIDPVVGDVGLAGFCDRDISMVKRTGESAAPNTRRQYDINDAVYMFTCMSGEPEQYIHFTENEIHVTSPSKVLIDSPLVEATQNFKIGGELDVVGHTRVGGNIRSDQSIIAKMNIADSVGTLDRFRISYNAHAHMVMDVGQFTLSTNNPSE